MKSPWILLMGSIVLTILSLAGAGEPKHIPRFAFDRHESPLNLPLTLRVVMVNMGPDAEPAPFRIDDHDFERMLAQVMSEHQPSCLETGERLHVSFEIFYDVVHASSADARAVSHAVKQAMRRTSEVQHGESITKAGEAAYSGDDKTGFVPVYEVTVEGEVEKVLDRLVATHAVDPEVRTHGQPTDGRGTYSLVLLNLDKAEISPDDLAAKRPGGGTLRSGDVSSSYVYRYVAGSRRPDGTTGLSTGSDTFVSKGRYAVADFSAGPTTFGNTQAGEGAVIASSLPRRYHKRWQPSPEELAGGVSRLRARALQFQAELASVVTSSVRFLFAPDIQFDELDFSEKVLVPIIVFRDHLMFDPLDESPGHPPMIDVKEIEKQLQRIAMPGQQVEVVAGLQSLDEHERVAIAFNKACRSDTVHESQRGRFVVKPRQYIDSKMLLALLAQTSDYLASGLIAASPVLSQAYFPDFQSEEDIQEKKSAPLKWKLGTRVLPVFVFSVLQHEQRPQLFDSWHPVAASKDAVLVVQSGGSVASLPFFNSGTPLSTSLLDPTAHIIAGVAQALGGLMPPHTRYSPLHKASRVNYLWAHGFSPFAPFGNATHLSDTSVDQVHHNSLVSRVDAALKRINEALAKMDAFADEYLFDPLGEGVASGKPLSWIDQLQKREKDEEAGALPLSYETVRKLHDDVLILEDLFAKGAEHMLTMDLAQMHAFSDDVFMRASAFHAHAERSLEAAQRHLECCGLKHQVVRPAGWSTVARAFLLGVIAVSVLALLAFLNPPIQKRLRPVVR